MLRNMNFWAFSGLINCLISLVFGFFVYSRNRKDFLHQRWFCLSLTISFWSLGYFFWQISSEKALALFWCRFLMIGAIFIPVFFLHFLLVWLNLLQKKIKLLFACYLLSFLALILNTTPYFVKDVRTIIGFNFWPKAGIFYLPFLLFWGWLILYCCYIMIEGMKGSSPIQRNQIKYVLLGAVIGFSGGITNYPLWYDIPIPPYGNILVSAYVLLVGYSIVKYQLMDIKVAITRAGIFLIVFAFVLGTPFLVLFKTKSGLLSTSLAVIFATSGPIIYRYFKKKTEAILLAKQRHYQNVLLQAADGMLREHNLKRLLKLIVYVVKRVVKVKFAAIFLVDKEYNRYLLKAVRGHANFPKVFTLSFDHNLISLVKKEKKPVLYDSIKSSASDDFSKVSHLVVPSFSQGELLALIVLGAKENGAFYSEDDIKTFEILSRQATLAIEHCIFLDKSKQTQEKIFAAEKLASIGGMADGVAHQIKNRLNHFSIAGGELKLEAQDFIEKNPDFFKKGGEPLKSIEYFIKIADSIIENVKKTDGVIKGILNFARTEETDTFFSNFSLGEIIKMSVELVKVKHQLTEFPLMVEIEASDQVYGVKAQVMEVIYNLLDNAYEACYDKRQYKLSGEEKKLINRK